MISLINDDCIRTLAGMSDNSVDLILTDPPYDLHAKEKELLHSEFMRISRNGVIVFSPPENQWATPDQYGFWIKPISTKNTSKRYSRFVEMIFFYGDLKWDNKRHWSQYTNVFNDLVDGESSHPFEKPTSLIERLMKNHTNSGDLVLDPFMGGGTTGLVARRINRDFIGIESNKEFFDEAQLRIGDA